MEGNIYYRLINLLQDLGRLISQTSKGIINIMSNPIIAGIGGQNYTILEFMIGSFFVVYAPYQIVKWAIPV